MDSIPTHTPNTDRKHSVYVYNTSNDTYYRYEDGKWKDVNNLRTVSSTSQILNGSYTQGDRILNTSTSEEFKVQADPFFLVDTIYSIPTGENYAVWQPGFNHEGEFVLDSIDNGDYRFQSNGSFLVKGTEDSNFFFDLPTTDALFEDGKITFSSPMFSWIVNEGEEGAEFDINGNTQNASLGIFTNTSSWFLNNEVTGGHLTIQGTVGDFRIRTSSNVFPFTVKDNAINNAFTIKANGVLNTVTIPTYADDTAAGVGGLVAGDIYKTGTGELRIKL